MPSLLPRYYKETTSRRLDGLGLCIKALRRLLPINNGASKLFIGARCPKRSSLNHTNAPIPPGIDTNNHIANSGPQMVQGGVEEPAVYLIQQVWPQDTWQRRGPDTYPRADSSLMEQKTRRIEDRIWIPRARRKGVRCVTGSRSALAGPDTMEQTARWAPVDSSRCRPLRKPCC